MARRAIRRRRAMALRVLDRRSRVGRGVLERVRGVGLGRTRRGVLRRDGDVDGGNLAGGVADESGRWRYGYYDATGSFVEGHFDDGGQWREGQPVGETKAAERVGGNGVGAEEVTEALGALSGLGGEVEGDGR